MGLSSQVPPLAAYQGPAFSRPFICFWLSRWNRLAHPAGRTLLSFPDFNYLRLAHFGCYGMAHFLMRNRLNLNAKLH
jgi:hypothetical protein